MLPGKEESPQLASRSGVQGVPAGARLRARCWGVEQGTQRKSHPRGAHSPGAKASAERIMVRTWMTSGVSCAAREKHGVG